jgi:nucleotide-binding universal stress UspA family protein
MAIKKILVPMSDPKTGASALSAAIGLARAFGAHVEALHVRPDPRLAAMGYMGEPMSASMIEEVMETQQKRTAAEAAKIRKAFEAACADAKVAVGKPGARAKVTASFREEVGSEDEELSIAGRVADLLVMARPQGQLAGPQRLTLEAALMDTGRPLLVVPPKSPEEIGGSVAIAWNGSTQASRAVALAMDFILAAESVTILTAKEDGGDARPDQLRDYLECHDVEATIRSVDAKGDAGKALLGAAGRAGADLLVMGAYGHSRVRELVLGGVTKHVLQATTIPTLLAH